jgi:S1-C subfamily serine protease
MTWILTHANRSFFGLLTLTVCLAATGILRANPAVYQRTLRSTAFVVVPCGEGFSLGTGVFVDQRRKLVLTNYHVVQEQPEAAVFFPSFRNGQVISDPQYYVQNAERLAVPGRVVGTDRRRDLALIQLQAVPAGVQALPLAADSPSPGQTIHAIGNSGAGEGTLWRYCKGEVRQVYRKAWVCSDGQRLQLELEARVVETQIPTNQGDSGGPNVNDRCELVAITQGGNQDNRLVSFSIHVSEIKDLLNRHGQDGLQREPDIFVPRQASPTGQLLGVWKAVGTGPNGDPMWIGLAFQADGSYVMAAGDAGGVRQEVRGRYQYSNGTLILVVDHQGQTLRQSYAVTWQGTDQLTLTPQGGTGVRFDRHR